MNSPPTSNVVFRTFKIRQNQEGSAFLYDFEGRHYLLTALHLVAAENRADFDIFIRGTWRKWPCNILASDRKNDLAIIRPAHPFPSWEGLPIGLGLGGVMLGQDGFFLGYPFGMFGSQQGGDLDGWVWPYIKKATLSAITLEGNKNKIALDAMNNPGFSGGPVVFQRHMSKDFVLAGIVTGMHEEQRFVEHFSKENGAKGLIYAVNSGLMFATSSGCIETLVAQNPNGCPFQN